MNISKRKYIFILVIKLNLQNPKQNNIINNDNDITA